MLNAVYLMGRVVRDPELRMTPTGKAVTTITLAHHTGHKDSDGKETVYFIDVTAWQQKADYACRYLHKGQTIAVEGELIVSRKNDAAGKTINTLGVTASRIHFADAAPKQTDAAPVIPVMPVMEELSEEDDLPF